MTALGAASALGYAVAAGRIAGRPIFSQWGFPQNDFLVFFLLLFVPLFLLTLVGACWMFRASDDSTPTLWVILTFALLFRLVLLPTAPVLSSDIFRYIWDARVQASGINPYLSTPADFDAEANKGDPLFRQQNRPFARTIYPPLAQGAFRLARALGGERVNAMKGLMLLGDLLTLVVLLWLLGRLGLPRSRIILYAWHPLVVFEVAGSGHVDALAIPFILLAVLLWVRGRDFLAGVSLGAAVLLKLFPILLLPALFSRRRYWVLVACGIVILLGYLPFLPDAGLQVLGHLPRFLSDPNEKFNPSAMGLVVLLASLVSGSPVYWAAWTGRLALLLTLAWLAWQRTETPGDLLERVWVVAGAFAAFTLTLHPWYLLWLVPLLAIQPRAAWIYLSGAIVVSYLLYVVPPTGRALISVVEYVPFYALLAWQWHRQKAGSPVALRPELAEQMR
ncbi:MAG: DUF2029 domain-containing protein [candidate division NC10 bacterium]|nr:DUF2029 domain-containing protein [candidate division NC10 bacterium]